MVSIRRGEGTKFEPSLYLNASQLSAVVLTFNEEAVIESCLTSLIDVADEVFVVDSGSTDRTLEIARRYTDKVVAHPFENYSAQRNWAQSNLPIQHGWILHVDAGEVVSEELKVSLRAFLNSPRSESFNGALVCRRTIFMGRWIRHGSQYPVYHLRLFRRSLGRCEDRLYDQHFVAPPPFAKLTGDLIDTVPDSLSDWTAKHLRWAAAEAQEQLAAPRPEQMQVTPNMRGNPIERRRWLRNSLFRPAPLFLRAVAYFVLRYVFRLGFLDGREGLIYHFLHGCWYRFYVDSLLYQSQREGLRR